jgi:hypothetical protein
MGPGRSSRQKIWVAGETRTDLFGDSDNPLSWDAFLLEIKTTGNGWSPIDVFGLLPGADNGALPPGKLDMHLTKKGHAVLMGNAELDEYVNATTPTTHAYLVERYPSIEERCVDEGLEVKGLEYEFFIEDLEPEKEKVKSKDFALATTLRNLNETVPCPSMVS